MPIGSSDGQQYENMFDFTLDSQKKFMNKGESFTEVTPQDRVNESFNDMSGGTWEPGDFKKPLSRLQIYPNQQVAGVVQPPSNVVPVPPFRDGPVVDPTMSVHPDELPQRKDMEKVTGREATLNPLEEDLAKLGVNSIRALGTPGVIVKSTISGLISGLQTALKVASGEHGRYEDNPDAYHEAAGVLTKIGMAKGLTASPEGALGSFGGRLRQGMEKATTKIDDLSQRMENRIQGKITEIREGNIGGKMQNIEDRIAYRLPENSRLREKLDQRAEDWAAGEQYDRYVGSNAQRLEEAFQRDREAIRAEGHGGAPSQHELYGQSIDVDAILQRQNAVRVPRGWESVEGGALTDADWAAYRAERLKHYEEMNPTPPEALTKKYHVTPDIAGEHIMYKDGKIVATMSAKVQSRPFSKLKDELYVSRYYGIEGDASIRTLGMRAQIEYLKQLRAMYPQTNSIAGFRVSGVRTGNPKHTSMPWSALDKPSKQTVAAFMGILTGAEAMSGDEAKAGEMTPLSDKEHKALMWNTDVASSKNPTMQDPVEGSKDIQEMLDTTQEEKDKMNAEVKKAFKESGLKGQVIGSTGPAGQIRIRKELPAVQEYIKNLPDDVKAHDMKDGTVIFRKIKKPAELKNLMF